MKVGAHYVVTKDGDDGTFKVGDHIHIYENGDIGCIEAQGWVSHEDGAKDAMLGCEVDVDPKWMAGLEKALSFAKKLNGKK